MVAGRKVPLLAAAALHAAACAGTLEGARTGPPAGPPLRLVAPDLEGRLVDVGAVGRVRVVELWASWCEPCREALPALDRLATELGPRGLSVYAVSLDEEAAPLAAFLREVPVRVPVLWDRAGEASAALGARRLPTTLVVDRAGRVRRAHEGFSEDWAREQRLLVLRLLEE
ncbi:MAG TPA: TlpA disulfide reductase family protein [Anaeromyxobacteraceae bacterium]